MNPIQLIDVRTVKKKQIIEQNYSMYRPPLIISTSCQLFIQMINENVIYIKKWGKKYHWKNVIYWQTFTKFPK